MAVIAAFQGIHCRQELAPTENAMLPQLLSLLNLAGPSRSAPSAPPDDEPLSVFECDSKLSVSETTHTEFSRALDALEEPTRR